MTNKAREIAALAEYVHTTETQYNLTGERGAVTLPFMPYQPADFIGILWECMPELPSGDKPPLFLDAGCGPGTKMQIAQDVFGFDVRGIEIDAKMAEVASERFDGYASEGDALDYKAYGLFDLIWLYRPFRDAILERELEELVIGQMKPGAILAGGSWETDLAALDWNPIVDDTIYDPTGGPGRIWRGAWQKPKVAGAQP